MKKTIPIATVDETLVELDIDQAERTKIMRAIQRAAEALAEEKDKEPKQKSQFVILVPRTFITSTIMPNELSCGETVTEIDGMPDIGWVVQLPEGDPPAVATDRIIKAAYAFNTTKKGRKMPVKTFGEACEVVPAKLLKEQSVAVKTRLPVSVLVVGNELPKEDV